MARIRVVVGDFIARRDENDITQFLFASAKGDTTTVRAMLQKGFVVDSTDYNGRTGLMLAAVRGHSAMVKVLLGAKAQPNKLDNMGNTALFEACIHQHDGIIQLMLEHGGTLDLESLQVKLATVLCTAVYSGDVQLLRRLLMAKAPADCGDYDRRTALHIAAAEGNVPAARVLLENGHANMDCKDRWGRTPLDDAANSSSKPMIEYLERFGSTGKDRS